MKSETNMKSVLVVDDDPLITMLLRSVFERAGYQVREASNGKDAMRLYRKSPTDLVIMDLVMPEKEGIETIIELRQDFPDARIFAITGGLKGHADVLLNAAEDLGAIRKFKKPLNADEILQAAQEVIDGTT